MFEFAEPPIDAVIVESFDKMRAYYSDDDMNVFSLSNCFYSFYKITEPRLIEEGNNNE